MYLKAYFQKLLIFFRILFSLQYLLVLIRILMFSAVLLFISVPVYDLFSHGLKWSKVNIFSIGN